MKKKEILELVMLGLQAKGLFSTENIVNALVSLPEKQQLQCIETICETNVYMFRNISINSRIRLN